MPMKREARIVEFFRGTGYDDECRTLEQMLKWDDQLMEVCHDYIQWLLPTDEVSRFNAEAPVLDEEVQAIFKADCELQANLVRGLRHFQAFLGVAPGTSEVDGTLRVVKATNFSRRILMCWKGPENHNWKRVSRALRCLELVGLTQEQLAFYKCLKEIVADNPGMIDEKTIAFWRERAGPAAAALESPETSTEEQLNSQPGLRRRTTSSVPGGSLNSLREYFGQVDEDGSGGVSMEELYAHVSRIVEERIGALTSDLSALLKEQARLCYEDIDLGLPGGLDMNEWLHFIMLHGSAPSAMAAQLLNAQLRAALQKDPELLARLLACFEKHTPEGKAKVPVERCKEALMDVGADLTPTVDLNKDGFIDYFEFVSRAVGITPSKVEVAIYDVSGYAFEHVLDGERLEGLWFTGVRVFDTDFFFRGGIYSCATDAGEVPFGPPARVEELGLTQRTKEELEAFIQKHLLSSHNPGTYDVLDCNANHFANEVTQFLLNGKQVPREVLQTPPWAMDSDIASKARPLLNKCLGGGRQPGVHRESTERDAFDDKHIQHWRSSLSPGDMVLHRTRFTDVPVVAQVMSTANNTVDIRTFGQTPPGEAHDAPAWSFIVELWDWSPLELQGVPLGHLWPSSTKG